MHAIVMTETGGPEVLTWTEVEDPRPGPGEVLVAVDAAGLNYIDTYHRRGLYPVSLPFTPGVEGAGTILETGAGVDGFARGDRIAWFGSPGAYAERAVVATGQLVSIPPDVPTTLAAAVMTQGMTAHYLVHDTFRLSAGDTCLIHAGAGGVGGLLIQLARRLGATVVTTVSTDEKAEIAREAGADHVVVYTRDDFAEASRRVLGTERPFDVVYDGVGASTFDDGLALLRPRGMMVLFGQASGPVPPVDPQVLNTNGSLFLTRPTLGDYIADRDALERRTGDLFGAIGDGWLDVRVDGERPVREAAEAHRDLEARATVGKVLLRT